MGREDGIGRCRIVVRGKVQGVGFRWFVRERARAHGLAGRVRNHPDGTVEVEAEGDVERIDALLGDLRIGPPGAQVLAVDVIPSPPGGSLSIPFTIER